MKDNVLHSVRCIVCGLLLLIVMNCHSYADEAFWRFEEFTFDIGNEFSHRLDDFGNDRFVSIGLNTFPLYENEYFQLRKGVRLQYSNYAELWVGGGFIFRIPLTSRLNVGLDSQVGFYDSGARDLGHVIEFNSSFVLGWELLDNYRLGLVITHMSNAGLGSRNPGSNALLFRMARKF